jgi:protein-S-isoprenylcysteine O-methyltransferase Ste14
MKTEMGVIVFVFLSLSYLAVRLHYKRKFSGEIKIHCRSGILDKGLVVFVVIGQGVIPALYIFSPILNWANYRVIQELAVCGSVVFTAGLWLFWRSHRDLDSNWSVILELSKNHTLIKTGVYSRIRHPMYTSFFIMAIGQGMLLNNWIAGLSAFISILVLYFLRVPKEERMMTDKFGQKYIDYRKKTGGVFPRI